MPVSAPRIALAALALGLSAPTESFAARSTARVMPAKSAGATASKGVSGKAVTGKASRKAAAKSAAEAAPDVAAAPGTTWTAGESANCQRFRRKLWQESEGWIVKTVSVCR